MMRFQPDSSQQKALKSWYSEGDPLYLDPRHPLIKLAGEAGELLDLYGKHEYKPGFSWLKCKYCNYDPDDDRFINLEITHTAFHDYTPLVLDELGDFWYYLRIICFINKIPTDRIKGQNYHFWDISQLLGMMAQNSCVALNDYLFNAQFDLSRLHVIWGCFTTLLDRLDYSIDTLTDFNYNKLNSEPTAHGWKKQAGG